MNMHGTCIKLHKKGILIIGPSGSGKSDIALRAIKRAGGKLVADDRVDISIKNNQIYAAAPKVLQGLLEVRGVGITKHPFIRIQKINLVAELVDNLDKIERVPEHGFYEIQAIKIPYLKLYPFEPSSLEKLEVAACKLDSNDII